MLKRYRRYALPAALLVSALGATPTTHAATDLNGGGLIGSGTSGEMLGSRILGEMLSFSGYHALGEMLGFGGYRTLGEMLAPAAERGGYFGSGH